MQSLAFRPGAAQKMMSTTVLFLSLRQSSVRRASSLAHAIDHRLNGELESIRQAGTWKTERIISTSQSTYIKVEHSSNELLNFCANNYLGLSNHKEVVQAAKDALDQYGAGLSSVRFICGTQTIHKERKFGGGGLSLKAWLLLPSWTAHRSISSTRRCHCLHLLLRRERWYLWNVTQRTGLCHQRKSGQDECEKVSSQFPRMSSITPQLLTGFACLKPNAYVTNIKTCPIWKRNWRRVTTTRLAILCDWLPLMVFSPWTGPLRRYQIFVV